MFKPHYLQDRLNAMILTPEEIEAFKAQRELHAKTTMTLAAQEKFEAARQASLSLLRSLFAAEEYEMPKIDARVFANHFDVSVKRQGFGTKH